MRPEAEQRLRAGFQRRVDKQAAQYAPQLSHAAQLAAGSGCGQLAGVFSMQAPFRARDLGSGHRRRPGLDPGVHPGSEDDPKTVLSAYRLRTADGRTQDISRDFKNVQDPHREMGQLFRSLAPNTIGTTMPTFPTVDQIISAYAR